MCTKICAMDSSIKKIYLNPYIEHIHCDDVGLEEIIAEEPLKNAKMVYLNDNKLTKFDVKFLTSPWEINLSNNNISEFVHKVPFSAYLHMYFNIDNNPIYDMYYTAELMY